MQNPAGACLQCTLAGLQEQQVIVRIKRYGFDSEGRFGQKLPKTAKRYVGVRKAFDFARRLYFLLCCKATENDSTCD